jgi:hypothetical protein
MKIECQGRYLQKRAALRMYKRMTKAHIVSWLRYFGRMMQPMNARKPV